MKLLAICFVAITGVVAICGDNQVAIGLEQFCFEPDGSSCNAKTGIIYGSTTSDTGSTCNQLAYGHTADTFCGDDYGDFTVGGEGIWGVNCTAWGNETLGRRILEARCRRRRGKRQDEGAGLPSGSDVNVVESVWNVNGTVWGKCRVNTDTGCDVEVVVGDNVRVHYCCERTK